MGRSEIGVDALTWLAEWYGCRCDGCWEEDFGVTIETLDNPGWSLRVDLTGTELERSPAFRERGADADDWMEVWLDPETTTFNAVGPPASLPLLVERFRQFVDAAAATD